MNTYIVQLLSVHKCKLINKCEYIMIMNELWQIVMTSWHVTRWHMYMTVWHRHNGMTHWHTYDTMTWHDDNDGWGEDREGGGEGGDEDDTWKSIGKMDIVVDEVIG